MMPYMYTMQDAVVSKSVRFKSSFNRVNILLGANGSGKSTTLRMLRNVSKPIFGNLTPVFVEGGRAVNINDNVTFDQNTIHWAGNPNGANFEYETLRQQSNLTERISRAFKLLSVREQAEKSEHSDAVSKWLLSERTGEVPTRRKPPYERLGYYFNRMFPNLKFEVSESRQLIIHKNAEKYSASSMSDGEKQVFILLCDLVLLSTETSLFLVDEPELNLHPTLAEELWTLIENEFPKSVFVYATHNISFALRHNVDCINVLGHGLVEVSDIDLTARHLEPFLGSLARIKHSRICLFVEGDDASFDKPFYRWLLDRDDVNILPVGSSNEVIIAASRQGLWQSLSKHLQVFGVIDRDFKSGSVDDLPNNVVMMDLHEAESYLCSSDIVCAINERLCNTEQSATHDAVLSRLVYAAANRVTYVASQRLFAQTYINLAVSVEKKGLAKIDNEEVLRRTVIEAASNEARKAIDRYSQENIAAKLADELTYCREAVDGRNHDSLLTIFEGKRFIQKMHSIAGCSSPLSLMKAVAKHLDPSSFSHTRRLRDSLLKRFNDALD